jgi:predicted permease
LLAESMLVAAVAGVLGFLLSVWLMRALSHVSMPLPMPVTYDLTVDSRALAFAAAVTLLTGVAFGLLPALHATRTHITPALKEGGDEVQVRHRRFSLRNLLLVAQLAGSLTLLVILGLLSFGIQSTLGIQAGFDAKNLYLVSLDPVRDGYPGPQAAAFFHRLLDRVQRLPGVTSAALSDTVPVALAGGPGVSFSDAGASTSGRELHWADRNTVGEDYFTTTGIPILRGRAFRGDDESDDATSVIVNEKLAQQYWPGEDPIGRRIELSNDVASGGVGAWPGTFDLRLRALERQRQVLQVVGVAGNVANDLVATKQHPAIYFPLRASDYAQPSLRGMTILVRALPGVDAVAAVQREVAGIDPNVTTFNARSMNQQIEQFMSPLRSASWTYGLIGVFGLVLASVGLAGVTAYSVARRRREIGIRMALGAQVSHVLALVMKEGALMATIGTAIGLAVAAGGLRLMSGLFASVASTSTTDPHVMLGAPLLLGAVALVACYLPARRSVSVDPAVILRSE